MHKNIAQAVSLIQQGKIISFATETVFALACDATNKEAVDRLYKLKSRQYSSPLAIFVKNIEEAKKYATFNTNADRLFRKFCPGPITLILNKTPNNSLASNLNQNNNTIGIRIPDQKHALAILQNLNQPLAATSANISGQKSATSNEEVKNYFADKVDLILEGHCQIGLESTIVDSTTDQIKIIRHGSLDSALINATIKSP